MMAKGDWIRRASTAELHAEIRAMDARRFKPTTTQTASNPSPADAAKALSLLRLDGPGYHGLTMITGMMLGFAKTIAEAMDLVVPVVVVIAVKVKVVTMALLKMAALARREGIRRSLPLILTSTVHAVNLLVMIYLSAGTMPENRRKRKRAMLAMAMAIAVGKEIGVLVGQNINQAMFKTLIITPLIR